MEIESGAPAIGRAQVHIHAPLEKVWALLTDIDRWPEWNPAVVRAQLQGPFAAGTRFRWRSGGVGIVSTLQDIAPLHRLAWSGRAIGTRAVHVWTLRETADGVEVATEESFDGWLVRLMKGAMRRTLQTSLEAWLQRLKQTAER